MIIRHPVLQIFERFTDTAPDTADDDQRGLPSCRLSFQDGTFCRVKSVMNVMKNHEYTIAHFFVRSIYGIQKMSRLTITLYHTPFSAPRKSE